MQAPKGAQSSTPKQEAIGPAITPSKMIFPKGTEGLENVAQFDSTNQVFWLPLPQLQSGTPLLNLPPWMSQPLPTVKLPGGFVWPFSIPPSAPPNGSPTANPDSPPDSPPTVNPPVVPASPPESMPSYAQEVLLEVNRHRAQGAVCGSETYAATHPLVLQQQLNTAALGHAQDMATNNYFNHDSRDGRRFSTRIRNTGYSGGALGENIAAGRATAKGTVEQWIHSPGHCSNIMSPDFKELGVGYAFHGNSRFSHYWVQNFGSRRN